VGYLDAVRMTYPVWRLTEKLNANKVSLQSAALESNAWGVRRSEFTFWPAEPANAGVPEERT